MSLTCTPSVEEAPSTPGTMDFASLNCDLSVFDGDVYIFRRADQYLSKVKRNGKYIPSDV